MNWLKQLLSKLFGKNQNKYVVLIRIDCNYKDDNVFTVDPNNNTMTFYKNVDGVNVKNKILTKLEKKTFNENIEYDVYMTSDLMDSVERPDVGKIDVLVNQRETEKSQYVFVKSNAYEEKLKAWVAVKWPPLEPTKEQKEDNNKESQKKLLPEEGEDKQVEVETSGDEPEIVETRGEELPKATTEQTVKEVIFDFLYSVCSKMKDENNAECSSKSDDGEESQESKIVALINAVLSDYSKKGDEVNINCSDNTNVSELSELRGELLKIGNKIKEIEGKISNDEKLQNYYKKTDVDSKLQKYCTKTDVDSKLKGYVTQSGNEQSLASKVNNSDLGGLKSQIGDLNKTVEEIKNNYEKSDVGQLRKEVEEQKNSLEQNKKDIKSKDKKITELEKSVQLQTQKNEKLTCDLNAKTNKLTETEENLNSTKQQLTSSQQKCEKQTQTIDSQKNKIKEQSETIEKQKREITTKDTDIREKRQKINDLESNVTSLTTKKGELETEQNKNREKIYDIFDKGLTKIKEVVEREEIALPCADNQSDCYRIKEVLLSKVEAFKSSVKKINPDEKPSVIEGKIKEAIKNELGDNRSWIYDVARYKIYSRQGFSIDIDREKGIALKKEAINELWNELEKILATFGYSLIMPDLFADTVSDITGVEDVTGVRSNLDNLVPNSSQYLENVSRISKEGVIRDCVEIGYKYENKIIKNTKVIR